MAKPSRKSRTHITRRQFLAGSAAAGAVLGMPGLLTGCGSDNESPPPPPGPREARTLHFDLSFADVREARLHAFNSRDHGVMLTPHTAESRAHFRNENPLLRGVDDTRLTHFANNVDLPSDFIQHLWLMGKVGATGEAALLGHQIHVPRDVRRTLAAQKRARGIRRLHSAKIRAYGLAQQADALELEDLGPDLDEFVTPWDAATAVVFHFPEIINLNLEQGPAILDLIQKLPCSDDDPDCEPYLSTLAFYIAQHWPATESGITVVSGQEVPAWARLVQLLDPDTNEPLLNDDNEPIYRPDLSDETMRAAQQTIRMVLKAIFDDQQFEGNNWHALQGRTATTQPVPETATTTRLQSAGFQIVAEHPVGSDAHGLDFVDVRVADAGNRTLEVVVRNWHMRTHAVHVQYLNESGPLPVEDKQFTDTDRTKFLNLVPTVNAIAGIPAPINPTTISFQLPPNASAATIYFGSFGVGGDPFCPEATMGTILTLVLNIIVPVIALAIGVKLEIADLLRDHTSTIIREVGRFIVQVLVPSLPGISRGIYFAASAGSATDFIVAILNLVANFLLRLGAFIISLIPNASLIGAVQLAAFGFALGARLFSSLTTLAEIIQSVVEVLANPPLFTNKLTFQMTTTVQIEHDPVDFRFPARARHYEVTLVFDEASALAHKMTGDIEADRVAPIPVVFERVPSGGKVTVDIVLTTAEGYIIGRSVRADGMEGPVGPLDNIPRTEPIAIKIKERLIPLTQATRYLHDLELKYQNGQHVWVEGPAPTATRSVLCQGQDDRLCTLGGITINQITGMAGYSFSAGGQGDRTYCGETSGGVMHLLQNVFLAANPDQALKVLPCGFRHPAGIVYERLAQPNGRHFFLEPAADGQSYFLESVVLDDTSPIGLNSPMAWGRFTQALESLAVVPTGYLVGVSRLNHKMEILELPTAPIDRANAPHAVPFAVTKGGEGTREGLMSAPVAVAVFDATILVLETGNARIQAFDTSGNPVRLFHNGTSAIVELEKAPNIEYLDLAVERLGYMYVLSSANGGQSVNDYRLDVLTPQANQLARTTGVAAARLAVDTFRNIYTLNYASIMGTPRVEPSLSQWVPSTPGEEA